ncbi:MAG: segregation and condensation protein A [Gammaproteobacteria bacterium]|nr:MAG: segregation and condensation protein A [Gammaproteobacteria bacterium]RKZ77026.1 MAG: segregation and condensation protein A [Gammaproteobacteria bacterium]
MNFDELSKEHQIMVTMRKVLSNIVREVTPKPGKEHPLSEQTIQDIRMCFGLITARERELAEEQGIVNLERPHYVDKKKCH